MSKEYEIAKLEVTKLELKDGDILAVKLNGHPRMEEIEHVKSYLKKMLPSGVSALVFGSDDVELQIVTRPTMPAPDAVDSAASTSIIHASAESTSESES